MLARDYQCLWYFQNTKESLSGQACPVAAFVQGAVSAPSAITSPQGAHQEERGMAKVEQPQPFCLVFLREREKQLDRGNGWFVIPGSGHRGYAELERQAWELWPCPTSSKKSALSQGLSPSVSHSGDLCGLLSQAWAKCSTSVCVWLASPEHGTLNLQAWATLGGRAGLPHMKKLERRLHLGIVPETIPG